ncbi:hypothetical protein XPA_000176 [Xanthoria parietina]
MALDSDFKLYLTYCRIYALRKPVRENSFRPARPVVSGQYEEGSLRHRAPQLKATECIIVPYRCALQPMVSKQLLRIPSCKPSWLEKGEVLGANAPIGFLRSLRE